MKVARSNLPAGVESYDRHGFAVFNEEVSIESERYHPAEDEVDDYGSPAHTEAWQELLSDWARTQSLGGAKVRSLLKKGVPPGLRRELWSSLLGCKQLCQSSKFNYKASVRLIRSELVDIGTSEYCFKQTQPECSTGLDDPDVDVPVPPTVVRQIAVDIDRTFPTHRLFMEGSSEAKEGMAALFRILTVYALYNPAVGYCQGMSYIAGMLLMQMADEEEAFWAMVALFEKPKYLSGYFDQSLLRIQQHAVVFQKLLAQRVPPIARHLASIDLNLLTFVTPWFMCLYTSFPCWDTVLMIWDLMLLDGISTIFRVALAVLRVHQSKLLQTSDMSCILPQLLHPDPNLVCPKSLLPVVWRTTIDKWEIDALQAIVVEESTAKQGRKRRRLLDSVDGEPPHAVGKRPRGSEQPSSNETSVFQRFIGYFKMPASSRPTRPSAAAVQKRRPPSTTPFRAARRESPRLLAGRSLPSDLDVVTSPDGILSPGLDTSVFTVVSDVNVTRVKGVPSVKPGASVKRSRAYRSLRATSSPCAISSPWTDGLRALTLTMPVRDGSLMIGDPASQQFRRDNSVTGRSKNSQDKMDCTPKDVNHNVLGLPVTMTTESDRGDVISPCLIASEDDGIPAEPESAIKEVRFSHRSSAGNSALKRRDTNVRPLNTPSGRRFLGRSAKVRHSFKTFHTPTPVRRSQTSRLNCSSPTLFSPEVELKPMTLTAHMKKTERD